MVMNKYPMAEDIVPIRGLCNILFLLQIPKPLAGELLEYWRPLIEE
jgi:hypothetical protein